MTAGLRGYAALTGARFRSLLQYRVAALAGLGTQVFWGFIKIMVLDAFYGSSSATPPMSLAQVASYVWLGQALLGMLPWNVDRDAMTLVREGTVAYEMLRPLDLYSAWFTRALAWRTAVPLMRAVPMVLFAVILMPLLGLGGWALSLPPSLGSLLCWIVAQTIALLISVGLTTIFNISLIWTLSGLGASAIIPSMVAVLSGMIVPLPLFPAPLSRVLEALPFAYLVDVPFRLYTGHLPPAEAPPVLALGAAWAAVIVLLGRRLTTRAARRLVVQGG
jgi:ABC-2 type transport system permease protein